MVPQDCLGDGGSQGAARSRPYRAGQPHVQRVQLLSRVRQSHEHEHGEQSLLPADPPRSARAVPAVVVARTEESAPGDRRAPSAPPSAPSAPSALLLPPSRPEPPHALQSVQALRQAPVGRREGVRLDEEHEERERLRLVVEDPRHPRSPLRERPQRVHQRRAKRRHEPVRRDEFEERRAGVARVHLELHRARPSSARPRRLRLSLGERSS